MEAQTREIRGGPTGAWRHARLSVLAASLVLAGCASAPRTVPWPSRCVVGEGAAPMTLRVALPMSDAALAAPSVRGMVERVAFGHVYETVVRIDCEGRTVPALAQSWSEADGGRVWTFRLRHDARFADGSPLTAADVVASWSDAAALGVGAAADFEWVAASGDRVVRVALRRPVASPARFAARDLVVARDTAGRAPPMGTGPYVIEAAGAPLVLARRAAPDRDTPRRIEVYAADGADPRDALDAGVDVLVSGSPGAIEYARELAAYAVTPLPWNRSYVLAAPAADAFAAAAPAADALAELAHSVDPDGTRPAMLPPWWQSHACRSLPAPPRRARPADVPASRIIYEKDDPIGRAIADRIAALGWPAQRTPEWLRALLSDGYTANGAPIAVGLDERSYLDAIASGRFLAAVAAMPRGMGELHPDGVAVCTDAPAADVLTRGLLASPLRITPLLDARDHVMHRHGRGRFLIDGDAGILFLGGAP